MPRKRVNKGKKAPKSYVQVYKPSRAYAPRIRGRGDYTMDNPGPWGKFGKYMGGRAGKFFFGKPGKEVGETIGSYLHHIGQIFGSGDYTVSSNGIHSNSLMNSDQAPAFISHTKNEVRITHREYLGDILSSGTVGAFNIQNFPINPGVSLTFPWLSQVCGSTFQQYRFNGAVFEFRSMSADALNSTNTALGSVVMATDYDSKDDVFTSKQQMENTMFGVSCKPSSCMLHAIECKRSQTSISEQYIRAFAVPPNSDIRLYDLGRFSIATVGCQAANVNLGELWVTYDVSLIKQIEQPPGFLVSAAHYSLDIARLATAPVALDLTKQYSDNIGLSVNTLGTEISFPLDIEVGSVWSVFLQHSSTVGGAAAVTTPSISFTNGLVRGPSLINNGGSYGTAWPNPSPGAANSRITGLQYYIKYDGGGTLSNPPKLIFTASTVPFTAYIGGDLTITQINPKMLPA